MSRKGGPLRVVFGWALTVFAVLWLLLTGGCTLYYAITTLEGEGSGLLPFVLVVGALGIVPGVGLLLAGSKLRRPPGPG